MSKHRVAIGENIRLLRKENKLTQGQLADLLGIGNNKVISSWETGVANPNLSYCVAMSEIFRISLEELIIAREDHGKEKAPQINDPVQRTQVVEQLRGLEQKVLEIANQLETEKENREILLQKLAEYEQVMDDLKKNNPPRLSE